VNSDLVVSPAEQLAFMRRLVRHELPVRRQHIDTVKATLLMPRGRITNGGHPTSDSRGPDVIVRAKTGATSVGEEGVSWLVGHIEANNRQYVFVSRVRAAERSWCAAIDLARRVLDAHASRWG
jgi:beta-lactamase class D